MASMALIPAPERPKQTDTLPAETRPHGIAAVLHTTKRVDGVIFEVAYVAQAAVLYGPYLGQHEMDEDWK